jgi:hypothetical protein
MASHTRDDELYTLDLPRLAFVPHRPGFERAVLALLPEGSRARYIPGECAYVALPGGAFFRYGHDDKLHATTSDPREAWELLFSHGVIDERLFEELPSRLVTRCPQCASRRSSVYCARCQRALWTRTDGIPSVEAALWMASAAAELRAAEQLVVECYERLRAWGFRGEIPTVRWSFEGPAALPQSQERAAITQLEMISWRTVGEVEGYPLVDGPRKAMRGALTNPVPRGHRLWVQRDFGNMQLYDRAARTELVSRDDPAYAIAVEPSVLRIPFADHPNPFEPLVRLNTLGFYADTLDEHRAVIVALGPDSPPSGRR